MVVVSAVQAQALQDLLDEQEEDTEEADLWAKEVDDLGAPGTEPEVMEAPMRAIDGAMEQVGATLVEEETNAVVTMRAVPEVAGPDAALASTRQGFCLTSGLGEPTSRTQRTGTLAKGQGISRWCR